MGWFVRIQEKVKNSELDSVTTKCRIALKLKPTVAPALGVVPSATQSSPEQSFLSRSQEWHFVPSCSLTLQTHPDFQDTAGSASCLGLNSLLRAHVG